MQAELSRGCIPEAERRHVVLVDDCNEVTDYAIARRIIDMHIKLEESVEMVYSEEKVARYEYIY